MDSHKLENYHYVCNNALRQGADFFPQFSPIVLGIFWVQQGEIIQSIVESNEIKHLQIRQEEYGELRKDFVRKLKNE
ncbi:hypothetical protein [Paenibacillus sp. USDA918EY]|uniref:hypothetical protein n=1 Tax=Paenibacillus sp. USDA918EY TaxID=2689575 RepID=UPI001F1A02CA|nr:hypothetical protein [Paenibacillus sp. USDA918EY]